MKTGSEIVLEWFRKYSEQNGTPTPFEIRCQLELAIEHDKTELKKFRLGDVISQRELLLDFAEYSENDKISTAIDECVDNYLDSIKQ